MSYINRDIGKKIQDVLDRGKSVLLLGPRQTGKTTLAQHLDYDLFISLTDVRQKQRYEKNPGILANEIEALADRSDRCALVIVDEIQKIPILTDVVQDLIDRGIAKFLLTGSSARKLRKNGEVNLLPGRVIQVHLDPLGMDELPDRNCSLRELLLYGSLPEILFSPEDNDKEDLLDSYVSTYLEEEIRVEALVRDLGHFGRFLELAASESGNVMNLAKLARKIGITSRTIAGYYEILEDCLIIERIAPISESKTRHKLTKSHKYLFYDLGVRRACAREGTRLPNRQWGLLFEQFIGLEIVRKIRTMTRSTTLHFWSDPDGPEVDWMIRHEDLLIPIEVKYTDAPNLADARHLQTFMREYPQAKKAYIICQTPRPMKLSPNIDALPWQSLSQVIPS